MTKLREPRSFEDAITRILGFLGADRAAEAVRKSTSMVRQWSDPDVDQLPNVRQAAALDAAHAVETGEMPIGQVYAHEVARLAGAGRGHVPGCPLERITEMVREVSEAADAFRAFHGNMSQAQASEALREIQEAIDALERMAKDIEAKREAQVRPQAVA